MRDHLQSLRDAILGAKEGRLLEPDAELGGFSGDRVVGLLQRLARLVGEYAGACYVEIGVFQGLTLLSVAQAAPSLPAFGIDDFSLDPEGQNRSIVRSRARQRKARPFRAEHSHRPLGLNTDSEGLPGFRLNAALEDA